MNKFLNTIQTRPAAAFCFVFIIAVLIFFWDLGNKELFGEEGRRALCAVDYLQTGNWLVPQIFGEPYLNKPPGYPWMIVLSSYLFGGINEWSVRFPSAMLSVITVLLIFSFSKTALPLHTRLLAAMIYCSMFECVMKGRMGETDAALTCFVFAALWCWWHGLSSHYCLAWNAGSGLFLACAMVVKGPPALIFFYGTIIAFCISTRQRGWLISMNHWVLSSSALFFTCLWLFPFINQINFELLQETGSRELLRGDEMTLIGIMVNQIQFAGGSVLAYLPASFIGLLWFIPAVRHTTIKHKSETPFLLCYMVTGFVFFLLFPETKIRYILPIAPGMALFAAFIWNTLPDVLEHYLLRRVYQLFYSIIVLLGLLISIWCIIRMFYLHSSVMVPLIIFFLSCVFTIWLWQERRTLTQVTAALSVILVVILLMFVINVEKMTQYSKKISIKESAQYWKTQIGNDTVYINFEGGFNFFYYANVNVKRIDRLDAVPAEAQTILLVHLNEEDENRSSNEQDFMELIEGWSIQSTQPILFPNGDWLELSTLNRVP